MFIKDWEGFGNECESPSEKVLARLDRDFPEDVERRISESYSHLRVKIKKMWRMGLVDIKVVDGGLLLKPNVSVNDAD